jgi:hypothetical protein
MLGVAMLADDLLAIRTHSLRRIGALRLSPEAAESLGGHYDDIADELRRAERIVIDDASVAAIANLEGSDLLGIGENIELARPPFDRVWIEWANATRCEVFKRAHGVGGWMPKRSGYLLSRLGGDPTTFTAFQAFQKAAMDQVYAFPQGLKLDLNKADAAPPPPLEYLKKVVPKEGSISEFNSVSRPDGGKEYLSGTKKASALRASVARIANAMMPWVPEYGEPFFKWLHGECEAGSPEADTIARQIRGELVIDSRFLLATLLTLNTKDFYTLEDGPDMSGVNAGRIKHGKPPILAYRVLKIRPSRMQDAPWNRSDLA